MNTSTPTLQYNYTIHTPILDEMFGGFRAEFTSNQLFTAEELIGENGENIDTVPDRDVDQGLTWVFQGEGDFPLAYDGGFCIEVETSNGDYFELTPFGLCGSEKCYEPSEMTLEEQLKLRQEIEGD